MYGFGPSGPLAQLDEYVERLRRQLPSAPPALMDAYVTWAPWLAMVFGAFGVLLSVAGFAAGAVASPFLLLGGASGVMAGAGLFLALGLILVASLLEVAGGYLMLQRRATGWWLVAVGVVVGALNNLLSFMILGFIISAAIAYIHVEVRPRYT